MFNKLEIHGNTRQWINNYECRMRLTCNLVHVVQTFSFGRLETVLLFGQEDRNQIDSIDMKYTAFLVGFIDLQVFELNVDVC